MGGSYLHQEHDISNQQGFLNEEEFVIRRAHCHLQPPLWNALSYFT